MKKTIALFALAAVCCLTGCSGNIKPISENDERLRMLTDTDCKERYAPIEAQAAVYTGKYDSLEISPELNITRIISPVGNNGFVVVKGSEELIIGKREPRQQRTVTLPEGEYGIYTLDGGYRAILPRYVNGEPEKTGIYIMSCSEEYILYYTAPINSYGTVASGQYYDMHLLRLDDMTDKTIYRLPGFAEGGAVFHESAIYFDTTRDFDNEEHVIMCYNIESDELAEVSRYAESPAIYKGRLAYFIDEKMASYAAPLFDPAEYGFGGDEPEIFPTGDIIAYTRRTNGSEIDTVIGYIKDGKPFDIFSINDTDNIEVCFSDGCAVWRAAHDHGFESGGVLPMFYNDKSKSLVILDDERADYAGFASGGKMYFFGKSGGRYTRVLTLDISELQ